MTDYMSKIVAGGFEQTIENITELLKEQGFGVLTRIDMHQVFKNKLDADFHPYVILGVCNPPFAYKALGLDDKVGTMLPCNVVVQQRADDKVEVVMVNPMASLTSIPVPQLSEVTEAVKNKLEQALEKLN